MASIDAGTNGDPPTSSSYNKALTNVFEPGSANKIITMAAALESGVATPQTQLQVPDALQVSDFTFTDHDPHPVETMTPTDILATSSNIGTIMLGQQIGAERLDSYLRKFGFGTPTDLGFPDESGGLLLPLKDWSGTSIGTIPIGQGVAITALQMLEAFNVIANGGVYVEPKLVEATIDKNGERHDVARRQQPSRGVDEDRQRGARHDGRGGELRARGPRPPSTATPSPARPAPPASPRRAAATWTAPGTTTTSPPSPGSRRPRIRRCRPSWCSTSPSNDIYASDTSAPVFSRVVAYGLRRFSVPPPGVVLQPTVPAPTLTESGAVAPAVENTKVRQSPAEAPTTTPPRPRCRRQPDRLARGPDRAVGRTAARGHRCSHRGRPCCRADRGRPRFARGHGRRALLLHPWGARRRSRLRGRRGRGRRSRAARASGSCRSPCPR